MEIRLERSTLRGWRWEDKPSLIAHADNPNVSRSLRDRFPCPYTEADADRWLELAVPAPANNLAIEVNGAAAGGIGIEPGSDIYRRSAEIGFWLGETYWGRGIMSEALRAASDYAFEHFDLCRLFAGAFESNPASARVLEKAGFTLEGRLRQAVTKGNRTLDLLLFARLRNEERPTSARGVERHDAR
jgi:RimJ/RimL family protein N-acetyltransferase